MKRLDLLTEKDLLSDSHYPVQVVFNDVYADQFSDTIINYVVRGHGFGTEYGACVFPDDLDEYDIVTGGKFHGVEFGLHNGEEILLDYDTFFYYLKKVCKRYLIEKPDEKEAIRAALSDFQFHYCNNIKNSNFPH